MKKTKIYTIRTVTCESCDYDVIATSRARALAVNIPVKGLGETTVSKKVIKTRKDDVQYYGWL